jgi:hypothetical protein
MSVALAIALLLAIGSWRPGSQAALWSSDPVFRALLLDGTTLSGQIVALGERAIKLASAEGAQHELATSRLVKLTREVPLALQPFDRSHVILPDGDCLMRVVLGPATDTTLEVQSDALGKLVLPLESILGLIFTASGSESEFEELCDRVRALPRSTETVWLVNGDRLSGGFLGLDEQKIKIQIDDKPVEVDRAGVLALGFDPALVNYPRPKTDYLEVALKDGTRLGITGATLDEGSVVGTTRFGLRVRFSLGDVMRVYARSKSVVYLSERKPADVRYVPYFGPSRAYRINRTVDGHLFQLAGQTYDRGIGAESRTLLAYRLEPGDRRFQALVGVDERAGLLGSVVFRVLVDGKERFKTPALTDHDPPRTIDLDLSGAKLLILITEFGDRGNVRDLADWVEARIIR